MTFEEKVNRCAMLCHKLNSDINKIDPRLKVLVIVEDGEVSIVDTSNPKDLSEALGLLEVTKIRVIEQEKRQFSRRADVQEQIDKVSEKLNENIDKNSFN